MQRLATLAKSSGELIQCVGYYKRILKIAPADTFAATQIRQILQTQDKDAVLSPNDAKWVRWQDFYERKSVRSGRIGAHCREISHLLAIVLMFAIGIAGLARP